ncbi:hypothetical protein KKA13_00825 [Patescibacteria group bacterium]|nr:hypothetical protein [Patescibacteria group bacterium]
MKHIHFIGICGVGMSALAILWKKKGWKVTGSDVGFYPPISTHLRKHGVEYYPGWHPERIGASQSLIHNPGQSEQSHLIARDLSATLQDDNKPDLVVVGNVAGSENPEWKFVQEAKIPYVSYPELISQNLVKENSIVCAGTYGKTSSAILLSWILQRADFKPAYMFGGLSLNMEESADDPTESEWSVLEGDEYKTARWDNKAKFFSYKPTHLLLTSVKWDHADIYATEESYFEAFRKLIAMVPKDGLIVASEDVPSSVANRREKASYTAPTSLAPIRGNDKMITYGKSEKSDYHYTNLKQTKKYLSFDIIHKQKNYHIEAPIIGEYMADNICGAFAMANEIGIESDKIIKALNKFKGIKRRLEKRGEINGTDIFDDIAHSPFKAQAVLETLRLLYCHCEAKGRSNPSVEEITQPLSMAHNEKPRIFAIFEPNTGNRQRIAISNYDNAFTNADEVIIPRLTKIKTKKLSSQANSMPNAEAVETPIESEELAKIISHTHNNVKYFEDDKKLVDYIKEKTRPCDAVVFLGSHGFRGMIDDLVNAKF